MTYNINTRSTKPLVWLNVQIKSPPFSSEARRRCGYLLREIQDGNQLTMPDSRPLPGIGSRVHELRINDSSSKVSWRIIYRIDADAIIIAEVFAKQSQQTPRWTIALSRKRLKYYDESIRKFKKYEKGKN